MKKAIPVIIALILIGIVIATGFGKDIQNKYSYGEEYADLNEYFEIYSEADVPIVLQDTRIDSKATKIDGKLYLSQSVVKEYFTTRFYHDKNEKLLLYTTGTGTISTEVGSSEYIENGEKVTLGYPASVTKGDELFISMEYLGHFVNYSYEVFENPSRMQVYTEWGNKKVADIDSDTNVRWRGGVKSEILTAVKKGDTVEILEKMDEWTKIKTEDAFIGYVENKLLKNERDVKETPVTKVPVETFPSFTHDYRINLTWDYMEAPQDGYNLKTTLANTKALNVVSPTCYWLTDNEGNIKSIANEHYVQTAHKMGLEVWSLVQNFHSGISIDLNELLPYTSKRKVLVDNLVNSVLKYGADGINLDFEGVPSSVGADYVQFIRELSVKCHENNLILSVDNYVPTEYTAHYGRAEQGLFADYIIIMGYDEHYAGSAVGSVASMGWMTEGIEKTMELVPVNKIINAVPFYTRVWKTKGDNVTSEAVTMQVAKDFISRNKIKTTYDETTGQNYGTMTSGGTLYQVWLEDVTSLTNRINVMKSKGIAGIASWRVGQETSEVWDVIAAYMQN